MKPIFFKEVIKYYLIFTNYLRGAIMHKKCITTVVDFIEDIQNKDKEDDIYHIFDDMFGCDPNLYSVYKSRGCEDRINFNSLNGKEIKRKKISSSIISNKTNVALVGDYFYKILLEIDKDCLDYNGEHYDEFGNFFHYLSEFNRDLYDYMDSRGYVDEFFGIDNEELETTYS